MQFGKRRYFILSLQKYQKELEQLCIEIEEVSRQLEVLPEGNLIIVTNGPYIKWKLKSAASYSYIRKKEPELAGSYALRKYLEARLRDLKEQQTLLEKYISRLSRQKNHSEILLAKSPEYSRLLTQYLHQNEEKIDSWLKQPYPSLASRQEMRIHKTIAGIRVRSKSEALIVQCLVEKNIPFLYEFPLNVSGFVTYPDFTLLHPETFLIAYYEHLGMMDVESYVTAAYRKIADMNANGISQTHNLILSYEDKMHPLERETVEQLLDNFLNSGSY